MQTLPKLAIVLINYLQDDLTLDCIKSIKMSHYDNIEIILINQLSAKDSENRFKSEFPEIIFIPTERNIGFASACNLGIRKALEDKAEIVCLLNNDTIILPDTFSNLMKGFSFSDDVGIVGPKIMYYDKKDKVWFGGGKLLLNKGAKTVHLDMNQLESESNNNVKEVDFITGCALMFKREVLEKVGLLDERYFAYFEEVDFCYQVKKAGYKILYVPQSKLYHKVSSTTKKYFSGLINYYKFRNRLFFLKKHLPFRRFLILLPIVIYYSIKEIFISIIKGRFKDIISIPLGIIHFIIGRSGEGPEWLK